MLQFSNARIFLTQHPTGLLCPFHLCVYPLWLIRNMIIQVHENAVYFSTLAYLRRKWKYFVLQRMGNVD